jgi:hypothetical protein
MTGVLDKPNANKIMNFCDVEDSENYSELMRDIAFVRDLCEDETKTHHTITAVMDNILKEGNFDASFEEFHFFRTALEHDNRHMLSILLHSCNCCIDETVMRNFVSICIVFESYRCLDYLMEKAPFIESIDGFKENVCLKKYEKACTHLKSRCAY